MALGIASCGRGYMRQMRRQAAYSSIDFRTPTNVVYDGEMELIEKS